VANPNTLVSSFDLAVDEPAAGATPDATASVTFTCANGTTVTGTNELAVTWQELDGPSTTSDFRAMEEGDTFQEGKYYLVHTVREDGAFSVLPDGCYYNLMDSSSYEWSVNGRLRSNGDVPSNYIGPLGQEVLYPYTLTYNYDEDSHTATVIGLTSDSSIEGDLVIPETVRYEGNTYTVTAIGQNAFRNGNRAGLFQIANKHAFDFKLKAGAMLNFLRKTVQQPPYASAYVSTAQKANFDCLIHEEIFLSGVIGYVRKSASDPSESESHPICQ
jgi:hypothetical protein